MEAKHHFLLTEKDIVVTDRDTVEAEMESVLAERDRALEERDELRVRIVEMQQKEEATVSMSELLHSQSLPPSNPLPCGLHYCRVQHFAGCHIPVHHIPVHIEFLLSPLQATSVV